mgnify:CR=1 FL=1
MGVPPEHPRHLQRLRVWPDQGELFLDFEIAELKRCNHRQPVVHCSTDPHPANRLDAGQRRHAETAREGVTEQVTVAAAVEHDPNARLAVDAAHHDRQPVTLALLGRDFQERQRHRARCHDLVDRTRERDATGIGSEIQSKLTGRLRSLVEISLLRRGKRRCGGLQLRVRINHTPGGEH